LLDLPSLEKPLKFGLGDLLQHPFPIQGNRILGLVLLVVVALQLLLEDVA
jgi:hypothetical protein